MTGFMGKTIKHKYNTDVAFKVYSVGHLANTSDFSLTGVWINITTKNHFPIKYDTINIMHDQVKNWRLYNTI